MASEIRVNTINARSGIGTVSINDGGINVSGIVTAAGFSGDGSRLTNLIVPGGIKQIVRTTYSTQTTHTAAWGDTGLTATITPSTASSKILIVVNQPWACWGGDGASSGGIRIMKGTTVLYNPGDSSFGFRTNGANQERGSGIASLQYIDTPGAVAPVTYKTQGITSRLFYTNVGYAPDQTIPGTSQMYLIEIL